MYVAKQCKESTSRILQQPDGKKAQQFRMRDNRERRSQAEFMQKLHPIQCTTYIRGIIEEEKINADIAQLVELRSCNWVVAITGWMSNCPGGNDSILYLNRWLTFSK